MLTSVDNRSPIKECSRPAPNKLFDLTAVRKVPLMRLARVNVFILLFFCFTGLLWGQATTSLGGRITDVAGAVMAGANVTLTESGTGAVRTAAANKNGDYQFSQLLPGRYELLVAAPGFASVKKQGIELLVSQPAT